VELENEPPVTRGFLAEGAKLAKHAYKSMDLWRAAERYCKAARLGSTEAQYQLGMLYAFGQGVPQNRALAAALFSVAAQQGHFQAQSMLDTIRFSSSELPECMTIEGRLPEKPRPFRFAVGVNLLDLEQRISRLPASKSWIVHLVETMSPWYKVDARLALSIISVESNFEPNARSAKNAMGLMQSIPDTAERFNVNDAFNATQNIKAGLTYLRWLLTRYEGDVALVAAGYNAGEGAVDRYHGVPPYPETQHYVTMILSLYRNTKHSIDSKHPQQ
jgi:soluble lytic murein transglycosylase-like protein